MFTIKSEQTNKIIADEKSNVCFHSTNNESPPVSNILNKLYTPIYTPYGFVETTLPFW